jgi:hypothetical protein
MSESCESCGASYPKDTLPIQQSTTEFHHGMR